jgi:hypothetical protein
MYMPTSSGAGGVRLQSRDLDLLQGLFESRVMTLRHVTALYFAGKREAAKKRVQRLKAGGYLRERPRDRHEPSVLILAPKGYAVLQDEGHLEGYPRIGWKAMQRRVMVSPLTLRHELDVMDVKSALVSAIAARANLSIIEFSTWPALTQFKVHSSPRHYGQIALVKPDGLLRLRVSESSTTRDDAFFIELDRSTETLDILAEKAACYAAYYKDGGFAERSGSSDDKYRRHPFRVLLICKSQARCHSAAIRLLRSDPPVLSRVWLATIADVIASPLDAIWTRPGDYRHAAHRREVHAGQFTDVPRLPLLCDDDLEYHEHRAANAVTAH